MLLLLIESQKLVSWLLLVALMPQNPIVEPKLNETNPPYEMKYHHAIRNSLEYNKQVLGMILNNYRFRIQNFTNTISHLERAVERAARQPTLPLTHHNNPALLEEVTTIATEVAELEGISLPTTVTTTRVFGSKCP